MGLLDQHLCEPSLAALQTLWCFAVAACNHAACRHAAARWWLSLSHVLTHGSMTLRLDSLPALTGCAVFVPLHVIPTGGVQWRRRQVRQSLLLMRSCFCQAPGMPCKPPPHCSGQQPRGICGDIICSVVCCSSPCLHGACTHTPAMSWLSEWHSLFVT
jgi:hypothetical protein